MTANRLMYLDSSLLLSHITQGNGFVLKTDRIENLFCSKLVEIETHRTFERLYLEKRLTSEGYAQHMKEARFFFETVSILSLDNEILDRAKESFPTPIKALDSIHISSIIWLQKYRSSDVTLCTLDRQQANCAMALGFTTQTKFAAQDDD